MQHFRNPAHHFQTQINYTANLNALPYQAQTNATKTINGLGKIVDSFEIALFPELIDLLINSRAFIGSIIDSKIDKAYRVEPTIKINDDNIDNDILPIIQQNVKMLLSRPFHIKHQFGRNTPLQAILQAVKLAERHGGSIMLMCYDDEFMQATEGKVSLEDPINPNKIDTKRKLIFYPVSLSNGNKATAQTFIEKIQRGEGFNDIGKSKEQFYNVSATDIIEKDYVELMLFNNGLQYKVHTSRLVPIYSGIKSRTTTLGTQGWDMSALQGCMRSLIHYYIFIDTIPETVREKIITNVSVTGINLANANNGMYDNLRNMIKAMAENQKTGNINFLPEGTTVHRDNLNLADLENVHNVLVKQIVMETDALLMDITGEGADGFSSGNDVLNNSHEKLAKIHSKYDWVFEYFLSRLVVNTQNNVANNLQVGKVDIIFDLTPQKTAEEAIKEQQQLVQNVIQLQQAGIISQQEARTSLENSDIMNLNLDNQSFFE